jgi:hypothetical protein
VNAVHAFTAGVVMTHCYDAVSDMPGDADTRAAIAALCCRIIFAGRWGVA